MNIIKWLLTSRYKKLLHSIAVAKENEQRLHLPNGIILDFQPGHEYDGCSMSVLPHYHEEQNFVKKYADYIGQVIKLTVYDCFSGDVKVLAVGSDRIFIEIVDVDSCYSCQLLPTPGAKYWVGDWEIDRYEQSSAGFEPSDLPF